MTEEKALRKWRRAVRKLCLRLANETMECPFDGVIHSCAAGKSLCRPEHRRMCWELWAMGVKP